MIPLYRYTRKSRERVRTFILLGLLAGLWLTGCAKLFFEPEPQNSPVENFMTLWNTFNERYAPFEQRNVNWNDIFDLFRPQVSENTTDAELFRVFAEMLARLDDAHVTITAANQELWNANKILRLKLGNQLFALDMIEDIYLETPSKAGALTYGVIKKTFQQKDARIGYLHIQHFQKKEPGILDTVLDKLQDTDGMIVDLRHNFGGDFRNGLVVVSRFADQRRLAFSSKAKNGPEPDDFAPLVEWYLEPGGKLQYTKPVALLTDRYTVSAAERTVLAFATLPHIAILGDTTSGAYGEKVGKELPNGWFFSITPQIVFAADGKSYEGTGFPPDFRVQNVAPVVIQGSDRVMRTAITSVSRRIEP